MQLLPDLFPTWIHPRDRLEDLAAAAGVRIERHPWLGDEEQLHQLFAPEPVARSVSIRLACIGMRERIGAPFDLALRLRVEEGGHRPVSLHAFLACLGRHPRTGTGSASLSLPEIHHINGYACVIRYRRALHERWLGLFPLRSLKPGWYADLGPEEVYIVESSPEAVEVTSSFDG